MSKLFARFLDRRPWPALRPLVWALALLLAGAQPGAAQVLFGTGGPVPDFSGRDESVAFGLDVKGLPLKTGPDFGLEMVCLNVRHPHVSDLKIELRAPDGTSIWLSNRNGGDNTTGDRGADYRSTCFSMNGFNGYVYEGKAPFIGTYIPDGRFQFFNQGLNPNGRWQLLVHDLAAGNTGAVEQWSLVFGPHPAPTNFAPCNSRNAGACRCPDGSADCDLLPDLIVSEKILREQHREYAFDDRTYPGQLRLAVGTANIGWGPMHTRGSGRWVCADGQVVSGPNVACPDGRWARQPLEQLIYHRRGDSLLVRARPAGSNYYDERPGHQHFHADDWVEYTLRRRKNREPDPRRWPIVGRGTKASYCLFDSGSCNDADGVCQDGHGQVRGRASLANFGLGHFPDCEASNQGISVGGIDLYGINFEGQAVEIPSGTKNGLYYLVVEVDPHNLYQESDETNNLLVFPVELKMQENSKSKVGGKGK